MSRAVFLVALLCVTFFPVQVLGQIVITEIMYDLEGKDDKREWIEIYNSSDEPIDISSWKFFENDTNHRINAEGDTIITPGAYAIIADDASVLQSGLVFDSAFSLSNSGESLSIRNSELEDIHTVAYSSELGAAGDGNSLQVVDGVWKPSEPTPGAVNVYVPPSAPPPERVVPVRNQARGEVVVDTEPSDKDVATTITPVAVVYERETGGNFVLWLGIVAFVVLLGIVVVLLVNHREEGTIKIIEEYDD